MYLEQIGGVFIPVSHLERSILFYTETLGLTSRGIENWGDGKRGATLFFNRIPTMQHYLLWLRRKVPLIRNGKHLLILSAKTHDNFMALCRLRAAGLPQLKRGIRHGTIMSCLISSIRTVIKSMSLR
jgi:hypothetical protein